MRLAAEKPGRHDLYTACSFLNELLFDIDCDGRLMIIPSLIGHIKVVQRMDSEEKPKEGKCQEKESLHRPMTIRAGECSQAAVADAEFCVSI